ncbi:MAG: glycosyltransferase, partial [Planctomycetota bacterium]
MVDGRRGTREGDADRTLRRFGARLAGRALRPDRPVARAPGPVRAGLSNGSILARDRSGSSGPYARSGQELHGLLGRVRQSRDAAALHAVVPRRRRRVRDPLPALPRPRSHRPRSLDDPACPASVSRSSPGSVLVVGPCDAHAIARGLLHRVRERLPFLGSAQKAGRHRTPTRRAGSDSRARFPGVPPADAVGRSDAVEAEPGGDASVLARRSRVLGPRCRAGPGAERRVAGDRPVDHAPRARPGRRPGVHPAVRNVPHDLAGTVGRGPGRAGGRRVCGHAGALMKPKASVLTPTYRRPECLPLLYRTFRAQTYPDKELLILDDGPEPVIDPPWRGDPSVRYIHSPIRLTIGEKRNRLATAATGEVLVHFDD